MKEGEILKLTCQNCQQETNHKVLCSHTFKYDDKESDIQGSIDYLVVLCCGCERISLATVSACSEDIEYYADGTCEYVDDIKQYPNPKIGYGKLEYSYTIPDFIRLIYNQTCNSIANGDYILAGVGLRTIIEAICKDENVGGRNLTSKITNLLKGRYISKQDCEVLHGIRFMGNDATHKILSPTKQQVIMAIKIIENLLENKYCLMYEAYNNLDMPFKNYSDFYEFVILTIRNQQVGKKICIDEIWGKEKRRIWDDRISEYEDYLRKCKNDIRKKLDNKDELYYDVKNKYNKFYEIEYEISEGKMYIKKVNIDSEKTINSNK